MTDGVEFDNLNGPQKGLLADVLVALFGNAAALDMFLQLNDFPGVAMYGGGRPLPHITFDVVKDAQRKGDLERLVGRLVAEFPRAPALRDVHGKLAVLAPSGSVPAPPSRSPAAGSNALEWIIREGDFGGPLILAAAIVQASGRTCRIQRTTAKGRGYGTGFLVARDFVLTAHHVIKEMTNGAENPDDTVVTFGFAETEAGPQKPENVKLAADWLVAWQPCSVADLRSNGGEAGPDELDFALLRLAQPVGVDRGWVDIVDAKAPPAKGGPVFIFQHPKGEVQQYSIGWTLPGKPSPHRIRYDANTFKGSSGGLVLDGQLRPLALHHAGDPLDEEMVHEYNQGIPLMEIYAAIKEWL